MPRTCPKCKIEKDGTEFSQWVNNKPRGWCKPCMAEYSNKYYYANKEEMLRKQKIRYKENYPKIAKSQKEYVERNREKTNAWHKTCEVRIRDKFLEMYGNSCACCGESIKEFLTIEHKLGQRGISKKETGATAYRKATKNYNTEVYEILCFNCNCVQKNGRICPHKLQKST